MASEIKVNTIKDLGGNTIVTSNGSGTISGLPASAISSGTVATARLGSGTASSSTFLAGDSSYKTVSGTTINNNANNRIITGSGTANTLEGESGLTYNGETLTSTDGVSGASASNSAKSFVADSNSASGNGISILSKNDANGGIFFGDAQDNDIFKIKFDHSTNLFKLDTASANALVINQSGNVGIGETSPLGKLHVMTADSGAGVDAGADELVLENSGNAGLSIASGNTSTGTIIFSDNGGSAEGFIQYKHNDNYLRFGTSGGNERMRILSGGEVIINRTGTFFGGNILQIVGKNDAEVVAIAVATNGKKAIQFANAALSDVGSIVTSSSSVAYNTSSDYRLKENETPITDGITRLKTLKPYRFNWLADNDENGNPTQTVDGFFAHEVTAVPEAINGTKDAMHPEVLYKDEVLYTVEDELPEGMNIGDTKTPADKLPEGKNFGDVKEVAKPNHQSIDQSKLVPLLVASVQELIAENETLKTRITALENA